MTVRKRVVRVMQVPEPLSVNEGRNFFREIERYMNVDRPYLVLDCSPVHRMDKSVIHLLLCCLEEAMKRNGDVRLAGVPLEAEAILEATGISRLFDIFDTPSEAVNSFHQHPLEAVSEMHLPDRLSCGSESAA